MKEFRIAHIVPKSSLEDTKNNQYHMCLAHLIDDVEYREFYARMAKEGKFVLMDNGAAEGSQLDFESLLKTYNFIHPSEIVLPDTLYESGSTIQKAREFLVRMQEEGLTMRVMAVPQGHNLAEWVACARVLLQDNRINSIGVSKFLNVITKNDYVRFEALLELEKLMKEYNRFDIEVHLLGCDEGPLIVRMCKERFPFVRGCDSAFAYLAAQGNKMLTIADNKRPKGVIDFIDGTYYDSLPGTMKQFNYIAGVNGNNEEHDSWKKENN